MSTSVICRMVEEGNLLEAAMELNKLAVAKSYPGAEYAVLVVHVEDGVPDVQLPVVTSSASRRRLLRFPQPA